MSLSQDGKQMVWSTSHGPASSLKAGDAPIYNANVAPFSDSLKNPEPSSKAVTLFPKRAAHHGEVVEDCPGGSLTSDLQSTVLQRLFQKERLSEVI